MWIGYTLAKTIFTKLHLSEKINIFFPNFEKFFVKFSEMIRDKFILVDENSCFHIYFRYYAFHYPIGKCSSSKAATGMLVSDVLCIYSRVDDMLVTKSSLIDFASDIRHRHRCRLHHVALKSRKLPKRDWLGLNSNEYPYIRDISHNKYW